MGDEARRYLDLADGELRRVAQIVSQTLRFYRQATNPTETTCAELISGVLELYRGRLANAEVVVSKRKRAERPVLCFEGRGAADPQQPGWRTGWMPCRRAAVCWCAAGMGATGAPASRDCASRSPIPASAWAAKRRRASSKRSFPPKALAAPAWACGSAWSWRGSTTARSGCAAAEPMLRMAWPGAPLCNSFCPQSRLRTLIPLATM